jgi:hypothetical protein
MNAALSEVQRKQAAMEEVRHRFAPFRSMMRAYRERAL